MRGVLVDAGPLVALIDAGNAHHQRCVDALKSIREPLITVWPPFVEAMYLLGGSWRAQDALWSRVETGALALAPLDAADAPRLRELMEKYGDLPMDFADATLVALAEELDCTSVFTTDRTDFSVYRVKGRKSFRIVPTD